jgi:hypothetical protein
MYIENPGFDRLIRQSASVLLHERVVRWMRFRFQLLVWGTTLAALGVQWLERHPFVAGGAR